MTTTKSDCGCHDTPAPRAEVSGAGKAARTVFIPRDAVADARTPAPPKSDSRSATGTVAVGGFRGLNPQDGLFLRGEHLAAMQDYSRALVSALGTASGTGIVHGLGVEITEGHLVVHPGLAISPRGQLLLLNTTVRIRLGADSLPSLPADGYWKIELHWAWETAGSAPAFGSLCSDACGDGGAVIRPWREEGVEIRIVTESLPGLDEVADPKARGNWLSSAYFENERNTSQPWIVPGVADAAMPPLRSREWTNGTPARDERGVPLAIIYTSGQGTNSGYSLQVWTARRLVDGPAAHATWRTRLAMRPWSVFLAQVLQFECEILDAVGSTQAPEGAFILDLGGAAYHLHALQEVFDRTLEFVGSVKNAQFRNLQAFKGLDTTVRQAAASPYASGRPRRVSEYLGLTELPPAGYLPINEHAENLPDLVASFFGPDAVDVRFRSVRADQVADEVLAAQHRDRIPLSPAGQPRPRVDVLVPLEPADKASLRTPTYGWVAFVRRGPDQQPEKETEPVEVYVVDSPFNIPLNDTSSDELERWIKEVEALTDREGPIGVLSYPVNGWEYPGHALATETLEKLAERGWPMAVVGLAIDADEGPLAATRAGLFLLSLDSGYDDVPLLARGGRKRDAIFIVISRVD